jgi:hypothetical protein
MCERNSTNEIVRLVRRTLDKNLLMIQAKALDG